MKIHYTNVIDRQSFVYINKLTYIILLSIFMISMSNLSAQELRKGDTEEEKLSVRQLNIGDGVPDGFWEREFKIYNNGVLTQSNLSAFKGKLLVLDFWSTSCTPCLVHQREIEYFKNIYGDKLNVVMVNSTRTKDNLQKIEKLNSSLKERNFGIDAITSIIEDDYLHRLFPFNGYPFYAWINSSGNIQTYTFRNLLDRNYNAPFIDVPFKTH